jgi:glutamine amidotransferase
MKPKIDICILDYNTGNVGSIRNILRYLGFESTITRDKGDLLKASHVIIPGVGDFDSGMRNLIDLELTSTLNYIAQIKKTPILGICLGAQLMCKTSSEGSMSGLGWLDADVNSFADCPQSSDLALPNMGWRRVRPVKSSRLIEGLSAEERYYFVHNFYMVSNDEDNVLFTSYYGLEFSAMLEKENLYAAQFHPEKSNKSGMKFIKNFIDKT